MGRIGRIHTDLIRADPPDPPDQWSILLQTSHNLVSVSASAS